LRLASRRGDRDGRARKVAAMVISRSITVGFPEMYAVSARLNQGLIAGSREW
jgi:hypothetical protein